MRMALLNYAAFCLCILSPTLVEVDSILPILVQQVCRHGDRAPTHTFPNNANKDKWPQGPGYLTPLGESQNYENGQSFRQLWYPGLLSEVVYPTEIKVISSDSSRCIMSANAFLAALYPPSGPYVFEKGLNWQAFPTHTISPEIDYYLHGTTCPAWDAEVERLHSSQNFTDFLSENQAFINQTCCNAGYSPSEWTEDNLETVYDNLLSDMAHNYSIPSWVTEDVFIRIQNIANLRQTLQFTDQKNNYLDCGGGPLLGLMFNNMVQKMANNLTEKFIYYSAHRHTVMPFLGILDMPVGPKPPFASCAFLELYHSPSTNKYQVQYLFLNTTEGQLQQPMTIPGCDAIKCDWDTFTYVIQNKLNLDPKTACYDDVIPKGSKQAEKKRRAGAAKMFQLFGF